MQITNVEIFQNGKRGWYADDVVVETAPLGDGRTIIVKSMKICRFVSIIGDTTMGSIIARNFKLDKHEYFLKGEFEALLHHALDNTYIGLFDFRLLAGRDEDYNTFFRSLELIPEQHAILPSVINYFDHIGFRGVAEIKQQ